MMEMWFEEKIAKAESVREYEQVIEEVERNLIENGMADEARKFIEIAALRKNLFSDRETIEKLREKKKAAINYCATLKVGKRSCSADMIQRCLDNFPESCRKLYRSTINGKCSEATKSHFSDYRIENEYDLHKLMLAALSIVFPDARSEVSQDSGHHTVRMDIVIDSESSVLELKCTRPGMSERMLSDELAADIVHYRYDNLYFYIYDKEGIINNCTSFKNTYEQCDVKMKKVRVTIYNHTDI